jgi:hypothetical protein
MPGPFGVLFPAAAIGFGAMMIRPKRGFYPAVLGGGPTQPIIAQAVIEERHRDELTITDHPVEAGAPITDHAYKNPAEVIITCGWSNSPSNAGSLVSQAVGIGSAVLGRPAGALASIPATIKAAQSILSGNSQDQIKAVYQQLLQLQSDRVPFDVFTGKRAYKQMLIRTLDVVTDETRENVLWVTAACRQVLIAETQTVSIPASASAMRFPEQTLPVEQLGGTSLLPAATMTPDPGSLVGSIGELSAGTLAIQKTLDASTTVFQGPVGQLSGSLGVLQDQALLALDALPKPFSVPFLSGTPQEMSIALGNAELTEGQTSQLLSLKDAAEDAQRVVTGAQRQLPSTPGVPAALRGQLDAQQLLIRGALDQVNRVLR